MPKIAPSPPDAAAQKSLRRWVAGPTRSMTGQVSRAVLASAVAAVVDFAILVLLVERAQFRAETAAIVSYLTAGVVNYALCAKWVFPSAPKSVAGGFTLFTLLSLVGLGLTWLCLHFLSGVWGVHYTLAKVVALGLSFAWNFSSRKFFLFRS